MGSFWKKLGDFFDRFHGRIEIIVVLALVSYLLAMGVMLYFAL